VRESIEIFEFLLYSIIIVFLNSETIYCHPKTEVALSLNMCVCVVLILLSANTLTSWKIATVSVEACIYVFQNEKLD